MVKIWSENSGDEAKRYYSTSNLSPTVSSQYMSQSNTTLSTQTTIKSVEDVAFYIGIYLFISLLLSFLGAAKFLCIYVGSIRASRILFDKMTSAVLRAPLGWHDTVPMGRILNRFIIDFDIIDSRIPNNLVLLLHDALQLIGIALTDPSSRLSYYSQ